MKHYNTLTIMLFYIFLLLINNRIDLIEDSFVLDKKNNNVILTFKNKCIRLSLFCIFKPVFDYIII